MQKKNIYKQMLAVTAFCFLFGSCVSVKEFQKNKINDAEMELSLRKIEKGDNYFQSITEAASGADGGKVGGGCGCN
jgi:hypothetical protein